MCWPIWRRYCQRRFSTYQRRPNVCCGIGKADEQKGALTKFEVAFCKRAAHGNRPSRCVRADHACDRALRRTFPFVSCQVTRRARSYSLARRSNFAKDVRNYGSTSAHAASSPSTPGDCSFPSDGWTLVRRCSQGLSVHLSDIEDTVFIMQVSR